jgi:hypothetical protein
MNTVKYERGQVFKAIPSAFLVCVTFFRSMTTFKRQLSSVLILFSLLSLHLLNTYAQSSPLLLTEGKYWHGVYPGGCTGNEDDISCAGVNAYTQTVKRNVAWAYFSNNWFTPNDAVFPWDQVCAIHSIGTIPFIRLMLRPDTEKIERDQKYSAKKIRDYFANLDKINSGAVDSYLQRWGEAARDYRFPLIVEFGTEVNDKTHSWNASYNGGPEGAEKFKQAFRHIVELVRSKGATNITWVFHVTADDDPTESWNKLESYYPDDPRHPENDVVDWLGVSVYGAQTPKVEKNKDDNCPAFEPQMNDVYQRLDLMVPKVGNKEKPIFILEMGETANHPYAQKTDQKWQRCKPEVWAREAFNSIFATISNTDQRNPKWPRLRGFSWWNERWEEDGHVDMRVQDLPFLAGTLWRYLAQSPYKERVIDRPQYVPGFVAPVDTACKGRGCLPACVESVR